MMLFISNFVEKTKRGRWKTIIAMKVEKWASISAYDCSVDPVSEWNYDLEKCLKENEIEQYLDSEAYVFSIGHGETNGVHSSTLRKALNSEIECVVSIIPGKLAVCYGHSNELRICKNE